MLQVPIFGLALLCFIQSMVTLTTGKFSIMREKDVEGLGARTIGGILLIVAIAIAYAGAVIIPALILHSFGIRH